MHQTCASLSNLVWAAQLEALTPPRTQTAWRHLFILEADKKAVLLEASHAQEEGVLFEDTVSRKEARRRQKGWTNGLLVTATTSWSRMLCTMMASRKLTNPWESDEDMVEVYGADVLGGAVPQATPKRGVVLFLAQSAAHSTASDADPSRHTGL